MALPKMLMSESLEVVNVFPHMAKRQNVTKEGFRDGKMVLDYAGGPSVVTGVLLREADGYVTTHKGHQNSTA